MHHSDKISQEDWSALCEGIAPAGKQRLAIWLLRGATLKKLPDGVELTRRDWAADGYYRFVHNDGQDESRPLAAPGS